MFLPTDVCILQSDLHIHTYFFLNPRNLLTASANHKYFSVQVHIPAFSASCAFILLPVSTISIALDFPIALHSLCVPPAPNKYMLCSIDFYTKKKNTRDLGKLSIYLGTTPSMLKSRKWLQKQKRIKQFCLNLQ